MAPDSRLLACIFLLVATTHFANANDLAITNVSVIPMDAERILENRTVVIRNGLISSIDSADNVDVPENIRHVDGSGRFLMPGLMDLHTHVRTEDDLVNYAAWGVTTIMHLGGSGLSGLAILRLKEDVRQGRRVGPNVFTTNRVLDGHPRLNNRSLEVTDPATASVWQQGNINRRENLENFMLRERMKYELMIELTRRFEAAGILQVIGTDAALPGLFPGKAAHRELTELVKAGLSNYEALSVGTRNGGEFLRRFIIQDRRVGQVRKGYLADLVLLDANPLDDIRNARQVAGVIVNGHYTDRQTLDAHREALAGRYAVLRKANRQVDDALQSTEAGRVLRDMIAESSDDAERLDTIESRLNAAGYGAAYAGDMNRSLEILQLNTVLFPGSANTWGSLAEITLHLGRREEALKLYRKALQTDPGFQSAAEQIRKLEAGN